MNNNSLYDLYGNEDWSTTTRTPLSSLSFYESDTKNETKALTNRQYVTVEEDLGAPNLSYQSAWRAISIPRGNFFGKNYQLIWPENARHLLAHEILISHRPGQLDLEHLINRLARNALQDYSHELTARLSSLIECGYAEDEDHDPVKLGSLASFVRFVIWNPHLLKPSVSFSHQYRLIAEWRSSSRQKVILEFMPTNSIRYVFLRLPENDEFALSFNEHYGRVNTHEIRDWIINSGNGWILQRQ